MRVLGNEKLRIKNGISTPPYAFPWKGEDRVGLALTTIYQLQHLRRHVRFYQRC